MAVTPAAKDPNSFASSNIDGGKAEMAMWGGNPSPQMPGGPQPSAASAQAAFNSPQSLVLANAQQPSAQPQIAAQQDWIAHNQAMLQQMAAGAQQQQPAQPTYGIGPNNELQIGDQVIPMGDNPTMAAQALKSPAAQQSVTSFKPGFRPIAASDVSQYLGGIQRGGFNSAWQGVKELASRVPGAAMGMAGDAAKWAGLEGVGTALKHGGEGWDWATGADQPVDTLGRGPIGTWFVNTMAEAAPMIPILAATVALPETALPKAFAYLGDAALNFGLFGGQAAQQKKESLMQQGVSPEEATKAGWVDFFTQGGGMMAMGLAGKAATTGTYGAAQQVVSKLQQAVGKGAITAEQAAQAVTNPAYFARLAANQAGNIGVQGAAMAGMGAASAASNNAYGGQHQDVGDAALSGLGSGLSLGVLMSPLGALHQFQDSSRRAALRDALNTPTQTVDMLGLSKVMKASREVEPQVARLTTPDAAAQWGEKLRTDMGNAADANQFAHDTAAVQGVEDYGSMLPAPEAPKQPKEPNPNAAADAEAATKVSLLMNKLGITTKGARSVLTHAVKQGVDVEQIPGIDNLLQSVEGRKQAKALIDQLAAKGAGDGTTGPAGPAGVGGDGRPVDAGSVADGTAVPAGGPGGDSAGTGGVAPGGEPPMAGGAADTAVAPVNPRDGLPGEKATKATVKEEIPDFSLTAPGGEPSAAWRAAHPEETVAAPVQTDNLSLRGVKETGQQTLFDPEVQRKKVVKVTPSDQPRAAVDQGNMAGPVGEHAVPVVENAVDAKQSRKRQEVGAETGPESTLVPESEWKKAFGNVHGERISRRINGETFEAIGADHKVTAKAVENSVKRATADSIDKAVADGKINALTAADMKRQLERGQARTVEVKTAAEAGKEGGVAETPYTVPEKKELIAQEGTHITSGESTGTKRGGTKASELTERETKIVQSAAELAAEKEAANQALKEANRAVWGAEKAGTTVTDEMKAAQKAARDRLAAAVEAEKKANAEFMKGKPGVQKGKTTAEQIVETEALIRAAKKDGGEVPKKLADKLAKLKEKLAKEKRDEEVEDVVDSEDALDNVDDTVGQKDQDEKADNLDQEYGSGKGMKFGKGEGPAEGKPAYTAESLKSEISDFMGGRELPSDRIHIVDTAMDLETLPDLAIAIEHDSAFGWTKGGHVVLIADRIPAGEGRAKFMHEVGSHLGLDHMLDPGDVDTLAIRIAKWADRKDNSLTTQIAKRALERVGAADVSDEHLSHETVAYFVEEAMKAGMEPKNLRDGSWGSGRENAEMMLWLKKVLRSFTKAIAKLFGDKPMNLTAQDIVDMAYGAAHMTYNKERSFTNDQGLKFGKEITANTSKLPEHLREPVANTSHALSRWYNSGLDKVIFSRDLVERGVKMGLTALKRWDELRERRDARAGHFEKMAHNVVEDVRKFSDAEKSALSAFLNHSTLKNEWGYGPKASGAAKAMFAALSPRAQTVAKGIFEHNAEVLKEKQAAVEKLTSEIYDDLIKDANPSDAKDLQAEKRAFLKKYATLMGLSDGTPYASMQRRGDFVVEGNSPEYLAAKAKAEDKGATAEDRKHFMELHTDPKHHQVSSARDEREARELRDNLRTQAGFIADGAHSTYYPKSRWDKDLLGGSGVVAGMGRLRHQLERLSKASTSEAEKAKYDSAVRLLSNMWLEALSQSSARKGEMRRLGVHGHMDMVANFRDQGKADAHFISGIEHNRPMLDALLDARDQVRSGEGEDRTTKDNLMDEFMARHQQDSSSAPTPLANKITKTVALWQIATSPAHYLGNLMQPWTMTLPALQARHGYGEGMREFFKAYKEIGSILGKTGLLKSLRVEDMPADVRDAMKQLLELGRLDIGMNTEYTSMDLHMVPRLAVSKAIDSAADTITQASLKMEALNRLASAAAAYRLEKAKTGSHEKAMHYAADIIADTHGDHSRANAPRVFNTAMGKVALQFRKFQLVQLTHMIKMVRSLQLMKQLKGEEVDKLQQRAAVRMIMFTLAHTAALGGVIGMPGFSTLNALRQNIGHLMGQVDSEDWEAQLAKSVGDHHIAQLLMYGIPGLAGVDLTKKVGYGDMLGISPYADVDPTDQSSISSAMGSVLGGPFGSLVKRSGVALHNALVGNYYKALEGVMPQGIANVMKGAREGDMAPTLGGVTNTKNDLLMHQNLAEALLTAVGFTPSSKSLMQAETGAMLKSTEDFKGRLETLKERFANNARSGASNAGVMADMNELRQTMQERGFKPSSLGTLIKTPTAQLIRELFTTAGGVQYKPGQTGRAAAQFPE